MKAVCKTLVAFTLAQQVTRPSAAAVIGMNARSSATPNPANLQPGVIVTTFLKIRTYDDFIKANLNFDYQGGATNLEYTLKNHERVRARLLEMHSRVNAC